MDDVVIVSSKNTVMQKPKLRRFTREEVKAAFMKARENLQKFIDGDTSVKVYL